MNFYETPAGKMFKSGFCTATQLIFAGLLEPAGKESDNEDT